MVQYCDISTGLVSATHRCRVALPNTTDDRDAIMPTRIVWIQLYKRESDKADDTDTEAKPVGRAKQMKGLKDDVVNIDDLLDHIFNHENFKEDLAGVQAHKVYVYRDAACQEPLRVGLELNKIVTSDEEPLRFVRPRSRTGKCTTLFLGSRFDLSIF